MKTIKVGMVGAGQIAYHNAKLIQAYPQADLVSIADPSLKRAKAFKKEFNIARAYESGNDLLADSDIDAVAISVPNAFHAPISIAALKAGKHVLLDKPFALNSKEAQAVAAAAKKAKKVFMVGMNQRFTDKAQLMKALIERGDLGDIYHAKAYWLRRSGIPKFGTWFTQKKFAGGGAFLDIGVHALDLCLYLINNFKPVAVLAGSYTIFGNRGLGEGSWGMSDKGKHIFDVDDFTTAMIRMKNGATVHVEASWALHMENGGRNNIEIFGTEAGATLTPTQYFHLGRKKGEYEVHEIKDLKGPCAGTNRFSNWLDAILKKGKPCGTIEQSLVVQKTIDAIYASAKTGKEVRISC